MKTSSLILIGAAVVGGGILLARRATAAPEVPSGPSPSEGLSGVRHGIRYDGCGHFELDDEQEVRAYFEGNALRYAWVMVEFDEIKANPEPAAARILGDLFPECEWPPPESTTFGPDRLLWPQVMELVQLHAQGFEGGEPRALGIDDLILLALAPR